MAKKILFYYFKNICICQVEELPLQVPGIGEESIASFRYKLRTVPVLTQITQGSQEISEGNLINFIKAGLFW